MNLCAKPYFYTIFSTFLSRHIIAALRFNLNLSREVKKNPDGSKQVRVVWPKFKNGEATVRDVKVKPNFGKLLDFFWYAVSNGFLNDCHC